MSSSKRNMTIRRQPIIVDIGCSCRKGKLSSIFFSAKKPKKHFNYFSTSNSTTSNSTTSTTTTSSSSFSYQHSPHKPNATKSQNKGKITEESVAVEKDSSEPYLDFRESMVQMIVQNEIYGWDGLRELLHRMLSLNSPQYHPLILRAFSDVCQAVFSPTSP